MTDKLSTGEKKVLDTVKMSRILIPTLIGLGVIGYLMWRQFDIDEFHRIDWTVHSIFWILIALILLAIRHLAYAARLKLLSDGFFGWWKSIELIFIWEFSSAISPTQLGGSAVAFVMLAQEKLNTAKTATIVIYTIIMDTLFFLLTIPLLYLIWGPIIIRPGAESFGDLNAWGASFITVYMLMFAYGAALFYGLLMDPKQLKRLLKAITRFGFLRRFREQAMKLGEDLVLTSVELRKKGPSFHLGAFFTTATAWACRFLILNALIIGIVSVPLDFYNQVVLYARSEAMFLLMAFSPTPGGSGLAEIVFNGFLSDYVPQGISLLIAFVWRVITYYVYLFAGVIIIPNWIRKLIIERIRKRQLAEE